MPEPYAQPPTAPNPFGLDPTEARRRNYMNYVSNRRVAGNWPGDPSALPQNSGAPSLLPEDEDWRVGLEREMSMRPDERVAYGTPAAGTMSAPGEQAFTDHMRLSNERERALGRTDVMPGTPPAVASALPPPASSPRAYQTPQASPVAQANAAPGSAVGRMADDSGAGRSSVGRGDMGYGRRMPPPFFARQQMGGRMPMIPMGRRYGYGMMRGGDMPPPRRPPPMNYPQPRQTAMGGPSDFWNRDRSSMTR